MSGWIINVDGKRRHNWQIAKDHAVWATTKRFPISAGDDLFFWETDGGGLIAHAVAREDARPVSDVEGVPWPDHAERHYRSRFDLVRISEVTTAVTRSWPTLQELGEFSGLPNRSVLRIDNERGIQRLRSLVLRDAATGISPEIINEVEDQREAISSDLDARRFVERSVVERQGQPQFRRELLRAYGARCCISGCDAEPALEAAHIVPYRGDHTNTLANGLLLRADLHTLLDLFELTIDASTRRVHLSPTLKKSQYSEFDNIQLLKPTPQNAAPRPDVLEVHNREFKRRQHLA
ncbi:MULTISPECIES: HNH endonuclease [unclassified Kribbella]|uniref:HNH endonuclease n=1 Tax=unclassified Kribbella TaxID=2644121 RepID=UPI0030182A27